MGNIVTGFFKWYPNGIKWIPIFGAVVFLMFRLLMSETACYSSVVEVYGIPTGLGEKLEKKEREKCAAYWEIKDNTFFNVMTLTYKEPYNQLEVMKENSTAYNMLFFQPVTRIEIKYDEDKSQYLSLNQSSFEVAKENGYKEPVKISYYNSSNKLVLKLERNEYGKFDIIRYSSADMPQLLNSTLLYTQNEEVSENSLTSRQIEVTYNAEGLPETRRLSPYMYNANGINGEYYVYDENKRLNEWNARTQITTWGDRTAADEGGLRDYAHKEWNGLLKDFYYPRWKAYFQLLEKRLQGAEVADIDWYALEEPWTRQQNLYPVTPQGDVVQIARKVYAKVK